MQTMQPKWKPDVHPVFVTGRSYLCSKSIAAMMTLYPLILLLTCFFFLRPGTTAACTAFCMHSQEKFFLAKNLDWEIGNGMLVINKRGVFKTAFTPRQKKISWTSRFGNVTFNQFGKEFPLGGMNEAGLVIEELNSWGKPAISDSVYTLNEFQWVQYHLDNFATVSEMIGNEPFLFMVPLFLNLHYLIADKTGDVAIIEFHDNRVVIYHGNDVIIPVLSNNHYAQSLEYLKKFRGFGGDMLIPEESTSGERFVRAASLLEKSDVSKYASPAASAFSVLDSVRQVDTKWSIVYDLSGRRIHFKTPESDGSYTVDLEPLDFACSTQTLFIDINPPVSGFNNEDLHELDERKNRDYLIDLHDRYNRFEPGILSREILMEMADYAYSVQCRSR